MKKQSNAPQIRFQNFEDEWVKQKTSPQLDTVLKVLASLGKTLAVVPLEQEKV